MKRKTSIILLTYNHFECTKACIESIRTFTKKGTYELIVVDNASTDETRKYLKKQKNIKVLYNEENKGFPMGCNQGIELSSKENDILFLNNDTIVTKNWLSNLKTCLYSEDAIGAVGAVSNHFENRQGVSFTYENLEEMHKKAQENNQSNPLAWEEKAFLIGFCLLIKREVLNKIGLLDTHYSPGYIEDNDLSLRILKSGYKLMLCHDAFIHHELGTSFRQDLEKFYPILYKNRDYFYTKWHFDTFAFDENKEASRTLMEEYTSILDYNASIGVGILELKYRYKNAFIEGVEKDKYKREFAKRFSKIYETLEETKENYDCILIGNALEKEQDPVAFLQEIKKHLKKGGTLIGEFENATSLPNLKTLLTGVRKKKENTYTKQEMQKLLEESGFQDQNYYNWYEKREEEEPVLKAILEKYPATFYTYYTFRVKL